LAVLVFRVEAIANVEMLKGFKLAKLLFAATKSLKQLLRGSFRDKTVKFIQKNYI